MTQTLLILNFSVPTFKSGSWGQLNKDGEIQLTATVSDDADFSQAYTDLKLRVDSLLQQVNAENRIIVQLDEAQQELARRQVTLRNVNENLKLANAQLDRINKFIRLLGINPLGEYLQVNNKFLDSAVVTADATVKNDSVEEEIDSIPFDSEADSNPHEF
jgi:hypothetical protein